MYGNNNFTKSLEELRIFNYYYFKHVNESNHTATNEKTWFGYQSPHRLPSNTLAQTPDRTPRENLEDYYIILKQRSTK